MRDVLRKSHVAAATIAVLSLWTIIATFEAMWPILYRAGAFLATALAIFDSPSHSFSRAKIALLIISGNYFYAAIVSLTAAWLLSWWVYGTGPTQVLNSYRDLLSRRRANA